MTQVARPRSDVFDSGWTPSPVSPQIGGVRPNQVIPATSSGTPQGDTFETLLSGLAFPASGPQTLTVEMRNTNPGNVPVAVSLLQDGLVIASQTFQPSQSYADYTLTLSQDQINQITNYADLRVRVTAGTPQDGCCNTLPAVVHLTVSDVTLPGGGPGCWPASVTVALVWSPLSRSWSGSLIPCDAPGAPTQFTLRCAGGGGPPTYTMTDATGNGGVTTYSSLSVSCANPLEIDFAINGQTSQPYAFAVSPNYFAANAKVTS